MNVLLSIKPEFAFKIFSGNKAFEYRRVIFKEPVERIVVYASSPVKMVIGEFIINDILFENLDSLWWRTKDKAGISESYFYSYFSEKDKGYAIKVGKTIKYETPCSLKDLYGIKPPQSFTYVNKLNTL
jgi:predicted transcriptional regulator